MKYPGEGALEAATEITRKSATIVSVTPVALSNDSRTLKMAVTFARAGYHSVVAEGRSSDRDFSSLGVTIVPLYERSDVTGLQSGAKLQTTVDEASTRERKRQLFQVRDILIWPLRAIYRLIKRSPAHSIQDIWTLILHLRSLSSSVGIKAARRLPAADIYYVHAFDYAPALAMKDPRGRQRLIYDAHDMYHDLLLAGVPGRFVQRYVLRINKFFEWFLVRRSRARVSTSDPMARELTSQYRRPFNVIRNLHDARIDMPAGSVLGIRARLDSKIPRDALVLIAIGNVKEAHDFSGIAAVAAQSHGRIHLVGVGGNYKTVKATFEDAGAGRQFHDLGRLPARELVPAIRDADAAILPYVPARKAYEVFLPNGFGQAVAAGLPLLYPDNIPAIANLASSNGLGWAINPTQADSIARAIASLQNDASRQMVASNVSRFSQSFNWAQEEKKLLDLIERVLVA